MCIRDSAWSVCMFIYVCLLNTLASPAKTAEQIEVAFGLWTRVARSKTVGWTESASRTHGERGARAYNRGLGVEPPAGSRGRAPGQGVRGAKPPPLTL